MKVVRVNDVFEHVDIMLHDLYGNNPEFDNVIFVLGYHLLKSLQNIRIQSPDSKIIIVQMEQFYHGSPWGKTHIKNLLKEADEVWDYDESNAKWINDNFNMDVKVHPMQHAPSLKRIPSITELSDNELDIDLLFYGFLHEKRAKLLSSVQSAMRGHGKIIDLCGVYGEELDGYIKRAKIIANVHYATHHKQEQVRMFYPVINGRCVVSEVSPKNYMGNSIIQVPYHDMASAIITLINDGKWRDQALKSELAFKQISDNYTNLPISIKRPANQPLFPW